MISARTIMGTKHSCGDTDAVPDDCENDRYDGTRGGSHRSAVDLKILVLGAGATGKTTLWKQLGMNSVGSSTAETTPPDQGWRAPNPATPLWQHPSPRGGRGTSPQDHIDDNFMHSLRSLLFSQLESLRRVSTGSSSAAVGDDGSALDVSSRAMARELMHLWARFSPPNNPQYSLFFPGLRYNQPYSVPGDGRLLLPPQCPADSTRQLGATGLHLVLPLAELLWSDPDLTGARAAQVLSPAQLKRLYLAHGMAHSSYHELRVTAPSAPPALQCPTRCEVWDLPGYRSARKKWIHFFEKVNIVVFVVDLSAYCHAIRESKSTNGLDESLLLWEEICCSRWFPQTSFLLVFNKWDVFEEHIARIPFHWRDYRPARRKAAAAATAPASDDAKFQEPLHRAEDAYLVIRDAFVRRMPRDVTAPDQHSMEPDVRGLFSVATSLLDVHPPLRHYCRHDSHTSATPVAQGAVPQRGMVCRTHMPLPAVLVDIVVAYDQQQWLISPEVLRCALDGAPGKKASS